MKWIAQHQAKKNLGRRAPDTREVDGDNHFPLRLYYFHAPYCGPCKSMMPMIDKLQQQYPNLIKIDVSKHEELAQAFGVSATPVFIVVKDDCVSEVKIGAQRESWLQNKLTGN